MHSPLSSPRFTVSVLLGAVLLAPRAAADTAVPSLDLRGLRPSADPHAGLYYEPAASPATGDFNATLLTSYAWRTVSLSDPVTDEVAFRVLEHQLSADVVVGMGLFERLAVGIDLPFVIFEQGDEPTAESVAAVGETSLPTAALGDLKLLLKGTLVPPTNAEFGGFAMALHERLALPTGNVSSFVGEGAVSSETRLLLEYRYLALAVHGAAGIRLRAEREEFGCAALVPTATDPEPVCATTFGHEIPWGLALVFQPQAIGLDDAGRWTWFIESYGYLPAGPEAPFSSAALSEVQLGGGARIALAADLSLLAGVDAALIEGVGTAPVRGTLALGWAPRKHDGDNDGVRDDDDLCPEMIEDRDGYQDTDGCPDWDNDGDGVPDDSDQCQGGIEDEDGYADEDGCPDPDNDSDGVLDGEDACPNQLGVPNADAVKNGCPDLDPDGDGVEGSADRCPNQAEDKDGHADDDGCPDPDNDGDGLGDGDDACPDQAGGRFAAQPVDDGCPDGDGDGIADRKDDCPKKSGVASEQPRANGCPEGETAPEPAPPPPKPGGGAAKPGGGAAKPGGGAAKPGGGAPEPAPPPPKPGGGAAKPGGGAAKPGGGAAKPGGG